MELSQRLIQALNNNLRWCQTVAQLHNITHETQASLWRSQQTMPTFFPNLVALSPELTTDELQSVLPKSGAYFIKDSFATMKRPDSLPSLTVRRSRVSQVFLMGSQLVFITYGVMQNCCLSLSTISNRSTQAL